MDIKVIDGTAPTSDNQRAREVLPRYYRSVKPTVLHRNKILIW